MSLEAWAERRRADAQRLVGLDLSGVTPAIRDLSHAVTTYRQGLAVIAELARATPEEGSLDPNADLRALAARFDEVDVAALALCADAALGADEREVSAIAAASGVPVVIRDLVVAREQVYLARLLGGDAVLLTAGVVDPTTLRELVRTAASVHMAALVEVQTPAEVEQATAAGALLLVVSAFGADGELDLAPFDRLAPLWPRRVVPLVRGPFASPRDLERVRGRADAVWISGPILRATDPPSFAQALVAAGESP